MKRNQNGFGIIEVLIIIVILSLLAVAGQLVYNRQKSHPKTTTAQQTVENKQPQSSGTFSGIATSTTKTLKDYTDKAGVYTLKYPASWSIAETSPGDNLGPGIDDKGTALIAPDASAL